LPPPTHLEDIPVPAPILLNPLEDMSVILVQILLHLGLYLRPEVSCANWKIVMVSSIQGELLPALKGNKLHLQW